MTTREPFTASLLLLVLMSLLPRPGAVAAPVAADGLTVIVGEATPIELPPQGLVHMLVETEEAATTLRAQLVRSGVHGRFPGHAAALRTYAGQAEAGTVRPPARANFRAAAGRRQSFAVTGQPHSAALLPLSV